MNVDNKKYLVCVDSDGCAIDSMDIKHKTCFGPALAEIWDLGAGQSIVLARWNELNLHSATRGINRFRGLAMILEEQRLERPESIAAYTAWTRETGELSNAALAAVCDSTADPIFATVLQWSRLVNEMIEELPLPKAFPTVQETLAEIRKQAVIVVVSSANKAAILAEWEANQLLPYVDAVCSQSEGSKTDCIRQMRAGYVPEHVLMIGDAPGDYQAAVENSVSFYPIQATQEEQSWRQLKEKYWECFLSGEYKRPWP